MIFPDPFPSRMWFLKTSKTFLRPNGSVSPRTFQLFFGGTHFTFRYWDFPKLVLQFFPKVVLQFFPRQKCESVSKADG